MPSEEIPTDGSPVYFTSDDGKSWQFTFVVPDEFIDTNFAKVGGDAPDTI
jgi:phage pi2 protein 07